MTEDSRTGLFLVDRTKSLLDVGLAATSLQVNQLGIFDLHTGLSVDEDTTNVREYQLGFGLANGDVLFSPVMQTSSRTIVDSDCYTPVVGNVIIIHDFKVECETSYSLQIVARTNASTFIQGALPIRKSYPVITSCCDDPCECGGGKCTDLGIRYARAMFDDIDKLVNVWLVPNTENVLSLTATKILPYDQTAIDAAIAANVDNPEFCFALRIEPIAEKFDDFCGVVWKGGPEWQISGLPIYQVEVALTEGHKCMGTITTIREANYGGTTGYDLKQYEYFIEGWQGGTLLENARLLETGQPLGNNNKQGFVSGTKYSMINISTMNTHHIGDNDRSHGAVIQLAVPCGSVTPGPLDNIRDFLINNNVIKTTDAAIFNTVRNCTCL